MWFAGTISTHRDLGFVPLGNSLVQVSQCVICSEWNEEGRNSLPKDSSDVVSFSIGGLLIWPRV